MDEYWVVARETADGKPGSFSKRQETLGIAKGEALRLAAKEKATFLVFHCVGSAHPTPPVPPPVEWTETVPRSEAPADEHQGGLS